MIIRTGIDLIEIQRLEKINPRIRQRFMERVFTARELAEVGTSNASLSGRFAAKEAVSKALGCGIGEISWQEIEVQRGPQGEPLLHLLGRAEQKANALGLVHWSLSITHTQAIAAAFVVGCGEGSPPVDLGNENPRNQ